MQEVDTVDTVFTARESIRADFLATSSIPLWLLSSAQGPCQEQARRSDVAPRVRREQTEVARLSASVTTPRRTGSRTDVSEVRSRLRRRPLWHPSGGPYPAATCFPSLFTQSSATGLGFPRPLLNVPCDGPHLRRRHSMDHGWIVEVLHAPVMADDRLPRTRGIPGPSQRGAGSSRLCLPSLER